MPAMKLYFSPGACSLSPHIVAREAGLPIDLVKTDIRGKTTANGLNFLDVNPKGYVPVLELDDGERLTEGPAIVQYLADQKPASGLAPAAGTMARYRVQEWLNFVTSEIHKQFSPLFSPAASADWKQAATDRLASRFTLLDKHLSGKQYLMGDAFTVADAYLFTTLTWAQRLKLDLSACPALSAYIARVAARPAVQEAMRAEGLIK
jgi:glutathione S-transferase